MQQPDEEPQYGLIQYSPSAQQTVEALDEQTQKKIAADLVRTWGRVLEFSTLIALQTFLHIGDFKSLNHLSRDTTLFVIAGFVFHVKIEPSTFNWLVVRVDTRPSGSWCGTHTIPRSPLRLLPPAVM